MTNDTLKPCPFCGGSVVRFDVMSREDGDPREWSPECTCGATIISEALVTKAEAITAWNTRTTAPDPVARAFEFTRYVNGTEMAEGICIEREPTLERAMRRAAELAPKAPGTVLVLKATPDLVARAVEDWQPIETAPRDGSPIRLFDPEHCDEEMNPSLEGHWSDGVADGDGGFQAAVWNNSQDYFATVDVNPTLWHPLPAPPIRTGEG